MRCDIYHPTRRVIRSDLPTEHLEQREYDDERTKYLEFRGYRVLRFWNHDVINNIDDVLKVIWSALKDENGEETKRTTE
jgi:very-short-patch-repair endonuclease